MMTIHAFTKMVGQRLLIGLVATLVSVSGLLSLFNFPSYAASATAVKQSPAAIESRQQAYEEAKEIANDVKLGIEKQYEENVDEFFEEHPEEKPGLIQEAEEFVEDLTAGDK